MKVSDRTLGYIALFALLIIFTAVAFGMWHAHHESTRYIYVEFDELGTLQPEDNVVVRGNTVGSVGDVIWLGDRARVQIRFNEPVIIREGTQFFDVNYALMGQRRLEIIPSKTGKVLPDDYIHTGVFEPGIAEALRLIENVNVQLVMVRDMVRMLTEGDSTHESIQQIFEKVMGTVEGTLESTEKMVTSLQPTLNKIFKQVDSTSQALVDVTLQADTAIKTASEVINQKLSIAEGTIKNISEAAQHTNEIVATIENHPMAAKVLGTSESVDKINEIAHKLSDIIKAIDTKGLRVYDSEGKLVKLIPWRNMNIVGKTAREKAAERAKLEGNTETPAESQE